MYRNQTQKPAHQVPRESLLQYRLVLLDTMVFSYHLSDHVAYAPLTTVVLNMVEAGELMGLVTAVTLSEILTKPAQEGNQRALRDYELFLSGFPNLQIVALDTVLARETAVVRGQTGLRTPDAVQVAAARLYGADAIITNDRDWARRVSHPPVLYLSAFLDRTMS